MNASEDTCPRRMLPTGRYAYHALESMERHVLHARLMCALLVLETSIWARMELVAIVSPRKDVWNAVT